MQAISFKRSSQAQTVVVLLATFTALLLLCLVLAQWTWVWLAPRTEPRASAQTQDAGQIGIAHDLFGSARGNRSIPVATAMAIRLLGVVAATGGRRGYALLQLEANTVLAVLEGEAIAPGIRLAEVAPDHIILERGAIRETLALPKPSPAVQTETPQVSQ